MILCISKQMFEYHTFWNEELDKNKKNSQSFHILVLQQANIKF
jgi:hypothetical protein